MLFDPEEHKVYAFHKIEDTRCAQLKAIWNKGVTVRTSYDCKSSYPV